MTSIVDRICDGMEEVNADDLRELNERIEATQALLSSLRRSRDDLLDRIEAEHAPKAHNSELEIDRAFEQRLAQDASEPGYEFWE